MPNLVFSRKLRSSALPSITVLISSTQPPRSPLHRCTRGTRGIDKTKREEEEERDGNNTDKGFILDGPGASDSEVLTWTASTGFCSCD